MIKTAHQLKNDWGLERYVKVMSVLSGLYEKRARQNLSLVWSVEELSGLSSDVLELLAARLCSDPE